VGVGVRIEIHGTIQLNTTSFRIAGAAALGTSLLVWSHQAASRSILVWVRAVGGAVSKVTRPLAFISSINSINCRLFINIALFFLEVFGSSWISGPESQVSNGIIGFCTLNALECIIQAGLSNAFVEAFMLDLVGRNPEDGGDSIGCKHNSQCSSKPIKDKSSSGFTLYRWQPELGGQMLQHVISWVSRGA
jgi:hypothetical protein